MGELALTPMEVGESPDHLPHVRPQRRLNLARPVSVLSAVHEDIRTVFVLWFGRTGL